MVQLEGITPLDLVVGLPLIRSPVTAGCEQAVQDGEEDGPLDVGLEQATVEQLLDRPLAARLPPEPLEDQGRSDAAGGDGGK